jgi:hypothetical protein
MCRWIVALNTMPGKAQGRAREVGDATMELIAVGLTAIAQRSRLWAYIRLPMTARGGNGRSCKNPIEGVSILWHSWLRA